ncbi:hypothetical protein F2Q69_00042305 [Brassica cretica]|uniref:Uncharacterized protein n=1 Tax=Brassica cretica TaxID=69181 RepID=A0A8S9NQ98_BRACR|nr:hypothetical protein F2Q69_00042305 [Brassica cretica]
MSSSHGDKRSSDDEMGEATSPAPIPTSPVEAPACVADHLSFRERLARRQAEKEQVRAGAEFPSSSALAIAPGHGTEVDKERAADSMPPPPARKEIVLALRAPSVVPVAQPKGRKRNSDVEMGEATSPAPIPTSPVEVPACVADHLSFRERLARRQAEKEQVRPGAEFPSSSALAIAPGHGTEVDKERAADSMPPPPAWKEIVLALRAPSVVPVAQPKGRKRKFTKGGDGESLQQGGSSIASGLRGKFMSLIDGMISKCGSETSRLAGELLELQGRWSETGAMLTAVKDSHSVKVSKLEVAIGELERDLGKTASSLLKEKKTRKAKSSAVHRLQRQIEGDAGLASRGIREATDALRFEFQARLAKISAFLGSLECIRNRDLALATIEGGVAVVQSFQSETSLTLEAEEARLSICKEDLAVVDGDFDLILADLKSACFLPTCSEGPEGKDPVLGESIGDAAPGLDKATGEEGA